MKLEEIVLERSGGRCELCTGTGNTQLYEVIPQKTRTEANSIALCAACLAQVEKREEMRSEHWKPLAETMWSEVPGVQVMAWRMLNRLRGESWAADSLELLYLDEERLEWAKASGDHEGEGNAALHKDANGTVLQPGDTVILTRSLDVKGTSFTAKLGTTVRNIRLVEDNPEQVEGRIEGQTIVILTKYVRKQKA